ncbi:hypothetical protein I4U23_020076 [Adineta vaga]|nr:hypothetical protein I4U23_020076 [Adineta vaga]
MQPIVLYQIPFSHYCDKIRWALDFYSLPYETSNYTGRQTPGYQKAPREVKKLTPLIEDPNNNSFFISDSTPILLYLDERYGTKTKLFPANTKDEITRYCLKLDSELGLYSRRLGYLHIISEHPGILSVFLDHQFDKQSCNDWKSYFRGLAGSCIIIGRVGIDRIKEENIFEKTICVLDEIQNDLQGKQYLFSNQFTAADLTLTSLIYPLRFVEAIYEKYRMIFDYGDRIRALHDPNKNYKPNAQRLYENRPKRTPPMIRNIFWFIFSILLYPLQFVFTDDIKKKPVLQFPSDNIEKKANNDLRVIKWGSMTQTLKFFIKSFWTLCFIIPKQMEYVQTEGKKLLRDK